MQRLLAALFLATAAAQVVVQKLEPNKFGGSAKDEAKGIEKLVPREAEQRAEPQVPPATARSQPRTASAIEADIGALEHAEHTISYMEEQAAEKLRADVESVDHLLVRRHLLTDRRPETDSDVAALEARSKALQQAAEDLKKQGKAIQAEATEREMADLKRAAETLRGSQDELGEVGKEIEVATAEGKRLDAKAKELAGERDAIHIQIRRLEREGEDLKEEGNSMASEDPYMKEAAEALERASGWRSDDLDDRATRTRDAIAKGLSGGGVPGGLRARRADPPGIY